MKNILSYQNGTIFTGKEIIDWANYQVNNKFYTRSDLAISDKFNRCYMGIAYRNQLDNSNYCWSTWNTWGSTTNDINNSFMK